MMRALLSSRQSLGSRETSRPTLGLLQRKCACGGGSGSACACDHKTAEDEPGESLHRVPISGAAVSAGAAPPVVHEVLRSPGTSLPAATRDAMGSRFGHDFGAVRVHADTRAAESARAVAARAYTVGRHVVFGANQYAPETEHGSRLLAHELTHVRQQGSDAPTDAPIRIGASESAAEREAEHNEHGWIEQHGAPTTSHRAELARKDDKPGKPGKGDKPAPDKPAADKPPPLWMEGEVPTGLGCGEKRKSRVNGDFPKTHIERIVVDIAKPQGLTLEWTKTPMGDRMNKGPFKISPGAGQCCVDCNVGRPRFCTPKVSRPVLGVGCTLEPHKWALNPTFFYRWDFAIHAGGLPDHPASHGCIRTTKAASALIHDNVLYGAAYKADPKAKVPDRRTVVDTSGSGTWSSPVCYDTLKQEVPFNRTDVCEDGKRKKTEAEKEEEKKKEKEKKEKKLEKPAEKKGEKKEEKKLEKPAEKKGKQPAAKAPAKPIETPAKKPSKKAPAAPTGKQKGGTKPAPKKGTTNKSRASLSDTPLPFAAGLDVDVESEGELEIALLEETEVEAESDWPGPAGP
jgi:outer membrane biosynthesis protein TonB